MKRGSYATQRAVAELAQNLQPRDHEIVRSLLTTRVATQRQLQRLHFVSGTPLSNARQCRRTLERLTELRVTARLDRRIGGARGGSSGFVYSLDVAGQRLSALASSGNGRRRIRPWTPSQAFLAHALAVTELRVRLVELEREGRLELLEFAGEPAAWRYFFGRGGGRLALKPDAYVRIGRAGYEFFYFVEVDRGTSSKDSLRRKLDLYRQYWVSGREQARHGVFPLVLYLVPDEARKAILVDVVASQPTDAWELFQVGLLDDLGKVMGGDR